MIVYIYIYCIIVCTSSHQETCIHITNFIFHRSISDVFDVEGSSPSEEWAQESIVPDVHGGERHH
jgi:hypothetical protein